ncbi:antiviral reverse transcriptase Drt2 [Dyella sp. ASV21]|uniref:antiviral reverse transcriptase Drt2 n=1 Tax=Dyella sp. ASV21 TaxID=2795114 RepID=UPI001E3A255E|nr:antiviral reverse transcriptase Drt2 [Dyella sp. ASV21]
MKSPVPGLEAAQRRRGYVHFDLPLSRKTCEKLVLDPVAVARHAFYPFLRHDQTRPRIKRLGPGKLRKSLKIREIRYAAHADSAIYAYYNDLLTERYEAALASADLGEVTIAFRALKKSNVDFAVEAFEWIHAHQPCTALGFDVQDFFGSLDHGVLKEIWASLLGVPQLPPDHYAVFRSITRHASVELIAARKALGISRQELSRRKRFCEAHEFRSLIRDGGLVNVNKATKGIPQGSPISAGLSNAYMLPFDEVLKAKIFSVGGFYRRYCDDILVVVPDEFAVEMKDLVRDQLSQLKLSMQPTKTLECRFSNGMADKPLQYLGLTFDGARVLLRPAGVARYYAKMRANVKLHKEAKVTDGDTPILQQRRKSLVRMYTEHAPPGHRSYLSYVKLAERKAKSQPIRRQLRLHRRRFRKLIDA